MLFVDIETLPAVHWTEEQRLAHARAKVPATHKKDDAIAKWLEENAEQTFRATSLQWRHGWIASVCLAWMDEEPQLFMPRNPSLVGEITLFTAMMLYFMDLKRRYPSDFSRSVQWVGWNIAGFDMPWLHHAALRAGAPRIARLIAPDPVAGKFKLPWVDLMNCWDLHQYGQHTAGRAVAEYLGHAEEAPELHGNQVYDQYLAGDWESIGAHSVSDVLRERETARAMGVYNG